MNIILKKNQIKEQKKNRMLVKEEATKKQEKKVKEGHLKDK